MKPTFLILIFSCCLICFGQKPQHSVLASVNFSTFSSTSDQIYSNKTHKLGGGLEYRIEKMFNKQLSYGAGVGYSNINFVFHSNCYCGSPIPENFSSHKNTIETNNVLLPLFLKLKLNKTEDSFFYFQVNGGLNWLFYSRRKVVEETSTIFGKESRLELIVDEKISFKNSNSNTSLGYYYSLAVGKQFRIGKNTFFSEIGLRNDINNWRYHLPATPLGETSASLKRISAQFSVGFIF
jgi:hypothetical protein